MTTWTSPGRCSSCKFCGMDMDMDPYCTHPAVLAKHPIGLNINSAIQNYCTNKLKLREEEKKP